MIADLVIINLPGPDHTTRFASLSLFSQDLNQNVPFPINYQRQLYLGFASLSLFLLGVVSLSYYLKIRYCQWVLSHPTYHFIKDQSSLDPRCQDFPTGLYHFHR